MSIAVLTPSRHRPQQLDEMLDAIHLTVGGDVQVYVGIDEDDASSYDIGSRAAKWVVGPRQQLAGWTNTLVGNALYDGHDIIASFGDDHRPRTMGWDLRVQEAMTTIGSGLVYTRDGLQDERLPTAPFWSSDVIRELGWFFPPTIKHLYADNWWLRFASDLGRRVYLPDVLIEHLHPSATGTEPDEINLDNDSFHDADREAFEAFVLSDEYCDCLDRVRTLAPR